MEKSNMKILQRLNHSKKAHFMTIGVMFAVLLVFNMLTKLLADDFQYFFSFATGKPIESFQDSIDSIIAHGKHINGRYFAHYVAQFFLRMPPLLFDLVNSAVFVATIYTVYAVSNRGRGYNNLFLIAIFGSVWLFEHDFGQVNLWLDGACNYLFAIFFGLIYLLPFLRSVLWRKQIRLWMLPPHFLIAFWFGGYLEVTSVGFIGASCLFLLADVFIYKNRRSLRLLPSILFGMLGTATMVLSPAQTVNKMAAFSLVNLLTTFGVSLLMILSIFPIILLYIVLFRRARAEQTDTRVLISSLILAAGALASNFVLLLAKYYALRCSSAFVFLSIFATALLYGNLKNCELSPRMKKFAGLFAVALVLALTLGLADNIATFAIIQDHEVQIQEAIARGEKEITLCRPVPLTKYNGLWGLRYLDIRDPDGWPNCFYARYYGLERVNGRSIFGDLFGFW